MNFKKIEDTSFKTMLYFINHLKTIAYQLEKAKPIITLAT